MLIDFKLEISISCKTEIDASWSNRIASEFIFNFYAELIKFNAVKTIIFILSFGNSVSLNLICVCKLGFEFNWYTACVQFFAADDANSSCVYLIKFPKFLVLR